MHEVKVALHPEVAVTIKINVARSPEEAEMQAEGVDVMAQMFEEAHDVAGFTEDYQASQDAAATLGDEAAPAPAAEATEVEADRLEEHTSELQSLMRISYAVFCLKKKTICITTQQQSTIKN